MPAEDEFACPVAAAGPAAEELSDDSSSGPLIALLLRVLLPRSANSSLSSCALNSGGVGA